MLDDLDWLLPATLMIVSALGLYMAASRKHYILLIFCSIILIYETPIVAIANFPSMLGDEGFWLSIQQTLRLAEFSATNISRYEAALMTWILSIFCGYLLTNTAKPNTTHASNSNPQLIAHEGYFGFFIIYFCMGVFCVISGTGEARLLDYTQDFYSNKSAGGGAITIMFYGQTLLVCCAGIIIMSWLQKKQANQSISNLLAAALLALPLAKEIFISGRRQFFVPTILLFLLIILYSPFIKNKRALLAWFGTIATALISVQFLLRGMVRASGGATLSAGTDIDPSLLPLLGEFIGVGMVSFNTVSSVSTLDYTGGLHLLMGLLHGVPAANLDLLFQQALDIQPWSLYLTLSPFGAFPMLADAWASGGWLGVTVCGLVIGGLLAGAHRLFIRASIPIATGIPLSRLYAICLTAALLALYRNGLSDCLAVLASFSVLFLLMVYIPTKLCAACSNAIASSLITE